MGGIYTYLAGSLYRRAHQIGVRPTKQAGRKAASRLLLIWLLIYPPRRQVEEQAPFLRVRVVF